MKEIIKDLLGINRYHIAWRYERCGHIFQGSTEDRLWRALGPANKFHATCLARAMNKSYGAGTHWVVRATR